MPDSPERRRVVIMGAGFAGCPSTSMQSFTASRGPSPGASSRTTQVESTG